MYLKRYTKYLAGYSLNIWEGNERGSEGVLFIDVDV